MIENWEIWLCDPRGQRIRIIEEVINWWVVHNANNVGGFALTIPADEVNAKDYVLDGIVEFWRAPIGGAMKLESIGMVRIWTYAMADNGANLLVISGPDQMDLLRRRIVAYAAGSAQANQSNQADDIMRDIVRQNLGSTATDTTRDLTSYGLTVEADLTLAASVDMAFSRKNVLEILQELAKRSGQAGTDLYFTLSPAWNTSGQITFEFQVVKDYLGMDRVSAGLPVVFGEEWGNLAGAVLEYDYSEEVSHTYGGGQGEEANRYVYDLADTAREGSSVWNRCEAWVDARECKTEAEVQSKVKAALEDGKPKMRFSGTLLEGDNTIYGLNWEFGDWVSCSYVGKNFDGMVKAVQISVDESGNESIDARFEVEQ